ncbi:MAG: nuclease-related domain-containing protein [Methanocorpusculum sp.]|nr:nuclease-related domain-containing protein [Methanocorpusculum sp.]
MTAQPKEWIAVKAEKSLSKIAGANGEKELFFCLLKFSEKLEGTSLISNSSLYVSEGQKKWSEIDLVMIHNSGIYVFENKYLSGTLTGKINDRLWMKSSDTIITIQNPIAQNKKHLRVLADYLDLPENFFKSVIVFSDNCDISGCPKSSTDYIVTHLSDLSKTLEGHVHEKIISDRSVEEIFIRVMKCADAKEKVVNEHMNYVNDIRKRRKEERKR